MREPSEISPRVEVSFPRSEALGLAAVAELLNAQRLSSSELWTPALEGLARVERAVRVEVNPGGDLVA